MTPQQAAAVVDGLGAAFATGDVDTVLARFVPDDDVIYAGSEAGEVAVGTVALRLLLEDLFARDERYSWRSDEVHVAAGSAGFAVLADATLFVDPVAEGERERFPYRVSGVLEAHGGDWRWRVCQGAEPAPAETG
jgi:hypothetical protein